MCIRIEPPEPTARPCNAVARHMQARYNRVARNRPRVAGGWGAGAGARRAWTGGPCWPRHTARIAQARDAAPSLTPRLGWVACQRSCLGRPGVLERAGEGQAKSSVSLNLWADGAHQQHRKPHCVTAASASHPCELHGREMVIANTTPRAVNHAPGLETFSCVFGCRALVSGFKVQLGSAASFVR